MGPAPSESWEPVFPEKSIWVEPGTETLSAELENYQLAGTFQTFEPETGLDTELRPVASLALVDHAGSGRQLLVREEDHLGPFRVRNIGVDQLTLTHEDQVWILALSGESMIRERVTEVEPAEVEAPVRLEDLPALETTAFGKRVSENQWVINRQAVFDYAQDIMGNPLRAAQLFRSFRQVAEDEEDEAGFAIGMRGERDFFEDMGLAEGDIIRNVNSMKMRSQLRAEYLVREFMHSRMSAVVLDVEREGEMVQQIYIVR
jgi:hypothetical protein